MAQLQKLKSSKSIQQVINPDLKLAFDTIIKKKIPYDVLYDYYRGNHPLRYSTERLRKAFATIGVYFCENWIAVVVDAVLDRLSLKGFDVSRDQKEQAEEIPLVADPMAPVPAPIEDPADTLLDDLWERYHMNLIADDVHEAATVTGEGYVIAWKEDVTINLENGAGEMTDVTDVYFNDPRMCHLFYDPYRPTKKLYGAKLWVDAVRFPRMILYYPDRLEHYVSTSKLSITGNWISSSNNFVLDDSVGTGGIESHDYGIIPVFHFRSSRVSGKRDIGKSELSLQDAINKLLADMMVSSEFTTWAQRVIISQSDPGDLKNGAGVNWWIPAGDGKGQAASVQEIGDRNLDNFMDTIERLAQALAIISRTPKHYLMMTGSVPSGDALLAMEAPLVKKVTKRIESYDPEWKSLAVFLLQLEGIEIDPSEISTVWEPATSTQPLTSAAVTKTETDAGIPLKTSLRRQGWAKDEIAQMEQDQREERVVKTGLAQQELDMLRASDAQSNEGFEERTATNEGFGAPVTKKVKK